MSRTAIAGWSLIVGCAVALILASFLLDLDWDVIPALGVATGVALLLYARLAHKVESVNRPADEAFDTGYEIGFDKGWRDRDVAERPKVIRIRRDRDGMG